MFVVTLSDLRAAIPWWNIPRATSNKYPIGWILNEGIVPMLLQSCPCRRGARTRTLSTQTKWPTKHHRTNLSFRRTEFIPRVFFFTPHYSPT